MAEVAALSKYSCPACGAEAVWNASKQALVCPYCGTLSPAGVAEAAGPIKEHDLAQALRAIPGERRGWEADRTSVQCQSCKAITLFQPGRIAARCEFCGSPAVVAYTATRAPIYPESLLPFTVPETAVREQIRKWYASHWFAPNKLKSRALTDTVHGVYLPYWTFDASVEADWRADSGYYYYETEQVRGSDGRMQTRQVRKTRWAASSGAVSHFFDDDMVPGTRGVDAGLLRQIEPFPARDLKPYDPAYVSGWVVEQYQIDLVAAAERSRAQMDEKLRALCAGQVPGDTHRNLEVRADYSGQTFKHLLNPVWLLNYTYGSRTFQCVVNGCTGTIAGRYPISWIKVLLVVLAGLIAILIFLALNQSA